MIPKIIALLLLSSFVAIRPAEAAYGDYLVWNTASGDWNVGSNWNGGLPTIIEYAVIDNNGTATVPVGVSGEYLRFFTGTSSGEGGAIEISGGVLSGQFAYLGYADGGSGAATITSGTWANPSGFVVGYAGTGSLRIDGGYVSSGYGQIGSQSTGNGSAIMTSGTWDNASFVGVGDLGTGELIIKGGYVSSTGGNIGYGATGNGSVTVTSGTWNNSGILDIGESGTGSLKIDGGYVSSNEGHIGAYFASGAGNGSVIVTKGTWNNASLLFIGRFSTGSLIVNGGDVSTATAYVGDGANGSATVTKGTWNSTGALYIGRSGTGSLIINGGYVSSQGGVIGAKSGSIGSVTVTSGTWNSPSYSNLSVGSSGTGTLDISGGLVHAGTITHASNQSTGNGIINLSGSSGHRGVLETGSITKGAGVGEINFDGGILRAMSNRADFLSGHQAGDVTIHEGGAYIDTSSFSVGINVPLDGAGALHKEGEGTLTLSGSNSYSGGTVLEAGTLIAAHNSALGTGSLTINAGTFSVQTGVILANQIILNGGSLVQVLAPGASLANAVNVTSDAGGETTGATLLDGDASAASNITGHFSAISDAENDTMRLGAVFSLSGVAILDAGTGETDTFVLQLQIANVTSDTRLGWLDPETNLWLNAIEGNIGGTATFLGDKAYNAATDFTLGNYGVDTASGAVWAVLNHNSDFAVVAPVPEPGSWTLLILGAGALWFFRRQTRLRSRSLVWLKADVKLG